MNSTIKAHLIRSAFYVLLFLGVCVTPFALAQQNAARHNVGVAAKKQTAAARISESVSALDATVSGYPQLPNFSQSKPSQRLNSSRVEQSRFPATSNLAAPAPAIPVTLNFPQPAAPAIVLYDQINNPAPPGGVTSQDFEPVFQPFDSFAADDFVVPAGQTWEITEVDVAGEYGNGPGPAASFHVFFYKDSGILPGTLVATRLANPYTNGANAMIMLTTSVTLTSGTYWVAVQARQAFTPNGRWFWDNRGIISNSGAAWQNSGDGFGTGWTTYERKATCLPIQNGPDQLFRLVGNIVGGTPSPTPCTSQYTITGGTDTIVPGTTDTGGHCDDCLTTVALPFNFQLYGNIYSSVNLSSNGTAQFVTIDTTFVTVCIPWAAHDFTIHALFQDMREDRALSGCSAYPGGSCGIYTSVSGTSPNRIFNIEWRAVLFGNNALRCNFELRLYENDATQRFDVVYGEINGTGATQLWSGGVQGNSAGGFQTSDFCNSAANPPAGNLSRTYTIQPCGSPTPTPTATATATPETIRPTPPPRLRPTPAPRP